MQFNNKPIQFKFNYNSFEYLISEQIIFEYLVNESDSVELQRGQQMDF